MRCSGGDWCRRDLGRCGSGEWRCSLGLRDIWQNIHRRFGDVLFGLRVNNGRSCLNSIFLAPCPEVFPFLTMEIACIGLLGTFFRDLCLDVDLCVRNLHACNRENCQEKKRAKRFDYQVFHYSPLIHRPFMGVCITVTSSPEGGQCPLWVLAADCGQAVRLPVWPWRPTFVHALCEVRSAVEARMRIGPGSSTRSAASPPPRSSPARL